MDDRIKSLRAKYAKGLRWTRSHDGSYTAIASGTEYTLARAYAGRGNVSNLWGLYVDGQYQQSPDPAGCTFVGVKRRAEEHAGGR